MNTTRIQTGLIVACGLSVLAGSGLAGCRGERTDKRPRQFFPDLDDQERFKPQTETEFFADGRAQRPTVAGTVAYGQYPNNPDALSDDPMGEHILEDRDRMIKEDPAVYFGVTDAPVGDPAHFVKRIPIEVTMELINLGRKNYDIYCSVCHGIEGDGQGPVGRRWSIPVANFYDERFTDPNEVTSRDGYIFNVARNGLQDPNGNLRMPGYGHALDETEAWAVVAYIRTLEQARGVPIDSDLIPDAERQQLLQEAGTPVSQGAQGDQDSTIAQGGEQ
ncbi:MAG TPA: cytochrome c [Phycisphaerales bacterium]|nr:cytochrome c [Phycisphaerales bacterium]